MSKAKLKFFSLEDTIPEALIKERLAVLGYGNLGRSFALNLRDSGITDMVIGNVADDYALAAQQDGFNVMDIAEATAAADVALVLLPDEVIPEVFTEAIAPHLSPGAAIVFASGYSLAYNLITPPPNSDVLLLAPRMAGEMIRKRYVQGDGFHAYVSVEQDHNGRAWQRLLGLAEATGALRAGVFELPAQQEADLDLFIEQTVGALIGFSILSAFATGLSCGLPADAILMELFMSGEMEMVWKGFREKGFQQSAADHGATATYGGIIRTMQLMQTDLEEFFRTTFEQIHNGEFAAQFQDERKAGYPLMTLAEKMSSQLDQLNHVESRLRSLLQPRPCSEK